MKGDDKILKLRLVQLPDYNMLIVKSKDKKTPQLIKAPRTKLVLLRWAASGLGSGEAPRHNFSPVLIQFI